MAHTHLARLCAGIWLLLDLSLLLTTGTGELYQLLLQLHGLRGIIQAAGEPKAQVQAFAMKEDLAAVSGKHCVLTY
jgi:hypothetical protein